MYRWADHTAELELHVEAATPEEVFAEAARALGELVGAGPGEPVEHVVQLTAQDLATLLVDFLDELVYLSETKAFVPENADIALDGTQLRAALRGRHAETSPLVKAVTYHGLVFARQDGVWNARVILDV
jgi:SHS2 domain-containing protein